MIAPRAMLTRGSVVAEVEETPLACIRVLDRECVCVCTKFGRRAFVCASCVSAYNRAYTNIGDRGGGELVFRRLTELGKQWTFDCSRFSSGFTTVEFLVSRYLLPVQLLLS